MFDIWLSMVVYPSMLFHMHIFLFGIFSLLFDNDNGGVCCSLLTFAGTRSLKYNIDLSRGRYHSKGEYQKGDIIVRGSMLLKHQL